VGECLDRYLAIVLEHEKAEVDLSTRRRSAVADTTLQVNGIRLLGTGGRPMVRAGEPIELELEFEVKESLEEVVLGISIDSLDGLTIAECRSSHDYGIIPRLVPGRYRIRCRIRQNPLRPGRYALTVGARTARRHLDYLPQAMTFPVHSDEAVRSQWLDESAGVIGLASEWTQPTPTS
jgi:hypothetical protein